MHSNRPGQFTPAWLALLGIAGGIFLTGCQQPKSETFPLAYAAGSDLRTPTPAVRFPEQTPFDDDPALRAFYLEWYANGYTLGVTNSEYASPGCRCEAKGDPRRYAAMADGFFDGLKAGGEAYQVLRERESRPQR